MDRQAETDEDDGLFLSFVSRKVNRLLENELVGVACAASYPAKQAAYADCCSGVGHF